MQIQALHKHQSHFETRSTMRSLCGEFQMAKKRKKMTGTVTKIIKPYTPDEPEKAEVDIHEADALYREIRVENVVKDENGKEERLRQGAHVDVIIEADSSATIKRAQES
jgi:hypothetical protein